MDLWIVRKINSLVGKCFPFDLFMDFVARFGHWLFVLYGAWLFFSGDSREEKTERRTCALTALAGVLLCSAISFCIGKVWNRPRPFAEDEKIWNFTAHKANASFPSNHTMNSAVISFSLLAFRAPGARVMAALSVLLAFSRVYAGIHYVTDLLGGAAVAAGVWLGCLRTEAFRGKAGCLAEISFLVEALVRFLVRR